MAETLGSKIISRPLDLYMAEASGAFVGEWIRTEWFYNSHDPYAIGIDFEPYTGGREWYFARGLATTGLSRPAGIGDVRFGDHNPDGSMVSMLLNVTEAGADEEKSALLWVPTRGLERFLRETYQRVPLGLESSWLSEPLEHAVEQFAAIDAQRQKENRRPFKNWNWLLR